MNRNNEGLIYKIAICFIFAVVAVFIVIVAISTIRTAKESKETAADTAPVFAEQAVETVTYPIETTATEGSTDQTSALTEVETTTANVTEPAAPASVSTHTATPPERNSTTEWDELLAKYPDTVLLVTEDAGQEYIDKLTFLGDSTTYGLRAYRMLAGGRDTTQVWTPASGTLTLTQASFIKIYYPDTATEMTIKEAVEAKKPEYLVITLGVNGIAIMGEDYFKSEYKKIIETVKEVSPDTKIICQSIFPVARSYASLDSINNTKIMVANKWILEVASETGVKFVDTYSALCDAEGWLPETYQNGDGMHLNEISFAIEIDNLRTHAYVTE